MRTLLDQGRGTGQGSDVAIARTIARNKGLSGIAGLEGLDGVGMPTAETVPVSARTNGAVHNPGIARHGQKKVGHVDGTQIKPKPVRPAAVLVPLVSYGDHTTVLLTRRNADLRHHAGQIAFPGGRWDDGDRDAVATALREAEEEIAMDPLAVTVVGQLDDYRTITGFHVTPVVGLIDPKAIETLHPDPQEVDAIFEVPLAFIMDPRNHLEEVREYRGQLRPYFSMPFGDHNIWGATAAMLINLYEVMKEWDG